MRFTQRASYFAAYVCLLLGFAMLGLFVYALAVGSPSATIAAACLALFFAAAVVGFRIAARQRAESNESGIHIDGVNVWAKTLRRDQIANYVHAYRAQPDIESAPRADSATADEYDRAA
jgi:hypothetical protein